MLNEYFGSDLTATEEQRRRLLAVKAALEIALASASSSSGASTGGKMFYDMAGLVSGVVSVHCGDDGNTHSGISLAGNRILVSPSGTDTAISSFYRVPAHNQSLRTHGTR